MHACTCLCISYIGFFYACIRFHEYGDHSQIGITFPSLILLFLNDSLPNMQNVSTIENIQLYYR